MTKNIALIRIFANNLKRFRRQRGLSQRTLFSLCGIDNGTISRMENGQINVTLATISTLADSLDVPCWEFLFTSDDDQDLREKLNIMLDHRYNTIKVLIEAGHIESIRDIFQFIPKTTVYRDLGVNFNRFDRAIIDPSIFRLAELRILAELFDVDPRKLIEMAYAQSLTVKRGRK